MTEGYKKVLTWGRGLSKMKVKKMLAYFMDGPFANSAAGPTLQIFQQQQQQVLKMHPRLEAANSFCLVQSLLTYLLSLILKLLSII